MKAKSLPLQHSLKEISDISTFPNFLTPDKIINISSALNSFMQEKKPYLQIGYCIRDLGREIGIPYYQLSAFMNHWMGMNFNDYLNHFRVRYCQQMMESGQK